MNRGGGEAGYNRNPLRRRSDSNRQRQTDMKGNFSKDIEVFSVLSH